MLERGRERERSSELVSCCQIYVLFCYWEWVAGTKGGMGGVAEELGTLIFRLGVFHKQVIRTASSESCPTLEEA